MACDLEQGSLAARLAGLYHPNDSHRDRLYLAWTVALKLPYTHSSGDYCRTQEAVYLTKKHPAPSTEWTNLSNQEKRSDMVELQMDMDILS
eukprot:898504-Pelagomonas_calceolata.AAC.4